MRLGEIVGLMREIHLTAKSDRTTRNGLTPCRSRSEDSDRTPDHRRDQRNGQPQSVDGSLLPKALLRPFAHCGTACESFATSEVPYALDRCGAKSLQVVHLRM